MRVLGIESSCDETAAAIVDDGRRILSNIVYSEHALHRPYGGVVPEIAARSHVQQMDGTVRAALSEAGLTLADIDAIAVTRGPGLIGGLIVGVMTAKALASVAKKPLIGVNHLEGHALTARLTDDAAFPYMLLLLSGGHCQIMLVRGLGQYELLGQTLDDALGEAFDKVAKMLGLPYPGGPEVEKAARQGDAARFAFSLPLERRDDLSFSFSGLKTAVRMQVDTLVETQGGLTSGDIADICAGFQRTAFAHLADRLRRTVKLCDTGHLVVAGGVAANQALRLRLEEITGEAGWKITVPPPKLCTDNAAMIAWAGLEHFRAGRQDDMQMEPLARWPLA